MKGNEEGRKFEKKKKWEKNLKRGALFIPRSKT